MRSRPEQVVSGAFSDSNGHSLWRLTWLGWMYAPNLARCNRIAVSPLPTNSRLLPTPADRQPLRSRAFCLCRGAYFHMLSTACPFPFFSCLPSLAMLRFGLHNRISLLLGIFAADSLDP